MSNEDDRGLKFEDGWMETTPMLIKLRERGYGVGGWVNPETGKQEFWLTTLTGEVVFETGDLDQLNLYLKLLIETEN